MMRLDTHAHVHDMIVTQKSKYWIYISYWIYIIKLDNSNSITPSAAPAAECISSKAEQPQQQHQREQQSPVVVVGEGKLPDLLGDVGSCLHVYG